ncbi:MAG: beta-lactamase class A [Desulforhopalus sp.]|jgi:beta-lactamase class A
MKFSILCPARFFFVLPVFFFLLVNLSQPTNVCAKQREIYDIIYLLTNDLERVLDYKEELETIFDDKIQKKIKVVGRGDEYALIYDGNDTARTVSRTLIQHAELLNLAGFDEPFATKDQNFHQLYNVSYGMGPNIDPLKKRYDRLYRILGEDVKQSLFIEKTGYGNYKLIYRRRGDKRATTLVARKHSKLLRSRKIPVSVAKENNNPVVYGESSLIDDQAVEQGVIAEKATSNKLPVKKEIAATKQKQKQKKNEKIEKPISQATGYASFEQSIEDYIGKLRRKGKLGKDESTGWMVYDLENDKMLININADQKFQAASMIKPFVALAFFHEVAQGKFKYGPKSRRKLSAMIQRSNNAATNWVMRQVGGPAKCEAILKKHYSHIFKKTEIKEYIPAGGRTYLNSAPPSDYVRFLRSLWNKKLPYSKEIRRLMALPGRDRLYSGTPIPKGTLVYNKTGSTAHLCGDMGILVPKTKGGGSYPYVVVGIIESSSRPSDYGSWMKSRSNVIRQVSTLVYKQLKLDHHLR